MESDSIRASGSNTLIDIWVEGRLRAICVTRGAIEDFLGSSAPAQMSDDDRCEFVRTHLPQVIAAVQTSLRGNAAATTVVIDSGQLSAKAERAPRERRKAERRKESRPPESLPNGDRRRRQRRSSDRRRSTKQPDA
jgi:hypothetical protein